MVGVSKMPEILDPCPANYKNLKSNQIKFFVGFFCYKKGGKHKKNKYYSKFLRLFHIIID